MRDAGLDERRDAGVAEADLVVDEAALLTVLELVPVLAGAISSISERICSAERGSPAWMRRSTLSTRKTGIESRIEVDVAGVELDHQPDRASGLIGSTR